MNGMLVFFQFTEYCLFFVKLLILTHFFIEQPKINGFYVVFEGSFRWMALEEILRSGAKSLRVISLSN